MRVLSFITCCLILCTFFSFAQEKELEKLIKTADSLLKIREIDQAISYYLNAETLAESSADSATLNLAYFKIGRSYRSKGNMPKAIAYYEKSEELSRSLNNKSIYSRTLGELGMSYSSNLQFDKAIAYYQKALKIQQEIGDKEAETVTLNAIAGAYFRNDDIDNSCKFSYEALSKARAINNPMFIVRALNSVGVCLYEKGDYEAALNHRKEALEICKKNNIPVPSVLIANIATNYRSLKKTDSALIFYKKEKQIAIKKRDSLSIAKINHNVGEMYYDLKNYTTSLEYFIKSYEYAKQMNHNFLLVINTDYLSKTYENLGNLPKALQFLQENRQSIDFVYQQSTKRKLEEFEIQYKVGEKDEEIATLARENMLKAQIIAQKQQQNFLLIIIALIIAGIVIWQNSNKKRLLAKQQSLRLKSIIEAEQKERKRIARDLHDSLGQSISTLKMQGSALKPSKEDVLKHEKLLKQMDHAYDELRHISHNIMPNALITLGLVPAVKELIADVSSEEAPKIELEHHGDFKTLDESRAISLYRIVQEALVNILKHAKATLVTIRLEKKQDTLLLHINDNGKGMEVSKLYDHNGMGWKNIYSRATLLSAKLDVRSEPGKGTSIAIQLKSR